MSDETLEVLDPQQESGQTSVTTPPQFTGQEPVQSEDSKPVTKAELKAMFAEFGEETKRTIQSFTDKQESRIRKSVDEKLQRLDEFAKQANLSDADKGELRKQLLRDEALRHIGDNQQAAQPVAVAPADNEAVETVKKQVAAMLKSAGVGDDADWDDPVWSEVNTKGNLKEYFDSMRTAAIKYAAAEKGQPGRSPGLLQGGQAGGPRLDQIKRRYQEIITLDPYEQNRELAKERKQLLAEMEVLER